MVEPFCRAEDFRPQLNARATLSKNGDLSKIEAISKDAYRHGRFHRDFKIDRAKADRRYLEWLKKLAKNTQVYFFFYDGVFAGYLAYEGKKIVLHALSPEFRGQKLAKFFWSLACRELFLGGAAEITSSVSTTNLAAVNLYASLGFNFRNPVDVYHKLV
ncbi:MAG: GNAT family N-acetyltransferase [Verrucomicrobiales bacterium]